ncbi:hypothetical protein C5137_29260 [Bacillus cereus]|uniref:hypothetical protein n=1 Tax=Bacillus cereus TaxID=1396 RepID=UPI001F5D1AE2|nr:hypothetical protein [Bacillus cereus]MCI3150151.1 hypothetical protein [Bacillus cereus]
MLVHHMFVQLKGGNLNQIFILYGSEVMKLVLWIIISILFGHIIFIKISLQNLKKRMDNYKEIMNIQNQKIDDVWDYVKKL